MGEILKLTRVSKIFNVRNRPITALENVSFEIDTVQIIGLVGHNGSGKTTILKTITGLLVPDSGSIHLLGETWEEKKAKDHVSLLLEGSRSFYWNLTGKQNLNYFAALSSIDKPKERIAELINLLELSDFVDRIVGTYSRGMQQRLSLAIALLAKPKVLLLDEPNNGLDYEWTQILANLLMELRDKVNLTVIVVSHDFGFLYRFVERMIFISQGRITKDVDVNRTTTTESEQLSFLFFGEIPNNKHLPKNIYYHLDKQGFYVFGEQSNPEFFQFISNLLAEGYKLKSVITPDQEKGIQQTNAKSYSG